VLARSRPRRRRKPDGHARRAAPYSTRGATRRSRRRTSCRRDRDRSPMGGVVAAAGSQLEQRRGAAVDGGVDDSLDMVGFLGVFRGMREQAEPGSELGVELHGEPSSKRRSGLVEAARVRWRGLEPPRPKWPLGPQPSASTNSATSACEGNSSSAVRTGRLSTRPNMNPMRRGREADAFRDLRATGIRASGCRSCAV
jgi:hypothetical protein